MPLIFLYLNLCIFLAASTLSLNSLEGIPFLSSVNSIKSTGTPPRKTSLALESETKKGQVNYVK
jgi:hypothetical protein